MMFHSIPPSLLSDIDIVINAKESEGYKIQNLIFTTYYSKNV